MWFTFESFELLINFFSNILIHCHWDLEYVLATNRSIFGILLTVVSTVLEDCRPALSAASPLFWKSFCPCSSVRIRIANPKQQKRKISSTLICFIAERVVRDTCLCHIHLLLVLLFRLNRKKLQSQETSKEHPHKTLTWACHRGVEVVRAVETRGMRTPYRLRRQYI